MKTENIKNIGEDKWLIDFTLNGQRIRKRVRGPKRLAQQVAIKIGNEIVMQKYDLPRSKRRIRFREYAALYEEEFSREKRGYENEKSLSKAIVEHFGNKHLDEIRPGDVDRFVVKLRKRPGRKGATMDPASINRYLTLLKTMLNCAIESEEYAIERNPVKRRRRLKENSQRERILSPEEAQRLLRAAKNPWGGVLPLFLTIALNTGARKTEILSLEWTHIDFANNFIEVTQERSKSGKARKIPMNRVVSGALEQTERRGKFVFPSPKKSDPPTHMRHIKEAFGRACRKAKLDNLRVHDLRHTAASWLVNDCGLSLVAAAKILGHSRIEMTSRYVHPTEENMGRGVERLGEQFLQTRQKADTCSRPCWN